jgi:hypothetical protein
MSHLILQTANPQDAWGFSAAIWSLAANTGTNTAYAVGVITHPEDGRLALHLGDYDQAVAADADAEGFVSILPIPQDERDALRDEILSRRGGRIKLVDMLDFTPTLAANLRSRDELEAAGWFPTENEG